MLKKGFFGFFIFFMLFPLWVKAENLICEYRYSPEINKLIDVTFVVSYDADEPDPNKAVTYNFNNNGNQNCQVGNFGLKKDDFVDIKSGSILCPMAYANFSISGGIATINLGNTWINANGETWINPKNISNNGQQNGSSQNATTKTNNNDYQKDLFDANCADFSNTLRIGGIIILIIKILLPLIIIVKSSIDAFSVTISGDPSELSKKVKKFLISIISAILIFFVPTIVNTIFGIVTNIRNVDESTSDIVICKACLFDPLSDNCHE